MTRKIPSGLNDNLTNVNGRTNPYLESNGTIRMEMKKVSLNIPDETIVDSTTNTLEFKDLDHDPNDVNILARLIDGVRLSIYNLVVKNKIKVKYVSLAFVFLLYNAYFITAIAYNRRNAIRWDWCDGHGLLIILTAITYWSLFYFHILKRFYGKAIYRTVIQPTGEFGNKLFSKW